MPAPRDKDGKLFDLAKIEPSRPSCEDGDLSLDDILVCGRRDVGRYRVPETPNESASRGSWTARTREMMERSAFESQTVGAGGALLYSRQVDYEWRQERAATARSNRRLEREIKRASRR
jgi:hypothetical protein